MSIEGYKHICIVCDKSAEMPYINKVSAKDASINVCSQKCFRKYSVLISCNDKDLDRLILKQANKKLKKEVVFSNVTIIDKKQQNG